MGVWVGAVGPPPRRVGSDFALPKTEAGRFFSRLFVDDFGWVLGDRVGGGEWEVGGWMGG